MKIRNPYSLSELSVEVIAKATFDRLIDCEIRSKIKRLIRDFVLNAKLPKFVGLQVIKLLLVYMDRGYNRHYWPRPPCEDASRFQDQDTKLLDGDVNDLGRRQRASWIMKASVHYVMSKWNDEVLHPADLLKDTLIAPRAMSMRGKQTVIMHMTESFIYWTDAISCDELTICNKCKEAKQSWPSPPHILELRAEHGNWMGTRIALAAISSSLKGITNFNEEDNTTNCQKCGKDLSGSFSSEGTRTLEQHADEFAAYDRPLIKLDVVLMEHTQDWIVEVLLFVLRNSSSKGVGIEISGIRCENVELEKFKEVVDSLIMPKKVRSLEYRTTHPMEIFRATETLTKLSGLESFIYTHIWRKLDLRTRLTAKQSEELGRILRRWNSLTKLRLGGISLFNDCNGNEIKLPSILPNTLQILEFYDGSLNESTLSWLAKLTHHNDNISLHTLRFEYEKILGSSDKAWKNFLTLLKNTRKSILTLAVDNCSIGEADALALERVYCGKISAEDSSSALQHLTLRDPSLSVKTTCNILTELCVASKYRNLSNFSYFGCLLPARTDAFWEGKLERMKNNSEWCPLQDAMRQICEKHGCSNVSLDLFWDPSEEDIY